MSKKILLSVSVTVLVCFAYSALLFFFYYASTEEVYGKCIRINEALQSSGIAWNKLSEDELIAAIESIMYVDWKIIEYTYAKIPCSVICIIISLACFVVAYGYYRAYRAMHKPKKKKMVFSGCAWFIIGAVLLIANIDFCIPTDWCFLYEDDKLLMYMLMLLIFGVWVTMIEKHKNLMAGVLVGIIVHLDLTVSQLTKNHWPGLIQVSIIKLFNFFFDIFYPKIRGLGRLFGGDGIFFNYNMEHITYKSALAVIYLLVVGSILINTRKRLWGNHHESDCV